jgi:NitT/TauT family transport system substrate-binding protein
VNKRITPLAIIAVLIVLTVSLVLGCTSSSGTINLTPAPNASATPIPVTTIKLGYLPTTGHALTFVAKEEGFFASQGLDVQLSLFPNSADGYNALTAGKLDVIAMGSTGPAVYIAKGIDLRYIGGLMGEGAAAITRPENSQKYANTSSWDGSTIATVRMSTGDVVYRNALKSAGIDYARDVTIQELSSPSAVLDAVKSGKADIGVVWLPYQQVAASQGLSVISSSDLFYDGHPCCRFVVTNSTLQQNRDVHVRFEKALIQAYAFAGNNKEKTVTDVAKYVSFNQSIISDSIYSPHFDYSPDPNKKAIEQWWQMMNNLGYINSTANIDSYIDTSVYKQALDEVIKEYPNEQAYQILLADYQKKDQ